MTEKQRNTIAEDIKRLSDPDEIARREVENALRQYDRTLDLIDDVVRANRPFRLRPSIITDLHRIALDGLSDYAGVFRPVPVEIGQSRHTPPPPHQVQSLVEDLCDEINEAFTTRSALNLCAYAMWRFNWIHPFTDGNGRTSRVLAYFVLCTRLGYRLPGHTTIPEQIAANKTPYYAALEAADIALEAGQTDVSDLEALLTDCLANQLASSLNDAADPATATPDSRKFH